MRRIFVISFLINHKSNSAVRRGAPRSESKSYMIAGGNHTTIQIPLMKSVLFIKE